jgi:putative membrane protein
MAETAASSSNQLAQTPTTLAQTRTDLADDRTALAVGRTIAAHDRTLMAWIRTATSMISFGFTIYKFFQALGDQQTIATQRLVGPRELGLVMICLGVGGLLVGLLSYRRQMAEIHTRYERYGPFPRSPVTPIAGVVAVLGIAGLVLVAFRL